jgi:serine/threonine-protein kinase
MAEKLANAISPDPLISCEFDGFKVEEKVGRGGMASIYRGSDAAGKSVALKVLFEEYQRMDKIASQFMNEALVIENVSHPNVVRGLGHGVIDGATPYIAMEYIDGIDLHSQLQHEKLPPRLALEIIREVCMGLEAVHEAGVIHRDLKPANIMLAEDRAVLIDFGICKPALAKKGNDWSGTIYGTINYVAPEQTIGENYDRRSDIYSLGVAAYRAVCGVLPIESDDIAHLMQLIRMMVPPEPSRQVAGVPDAVDRIIMRALSKEPGARFQSATEMAQEIEKFLSET